MVQDTDDVHNLWQHAFSELDASASRHPILMTEPLHVPRSQRLDTTTYVFETLRSPSYHTSIPAVLSAYAANLSTALVVDSGHTGTYAVPVRDFAPLRSVVCFSDIAAQAIDDWLHHALHAEGAEFSSAAAAADFIRLCRFERLRVVAGGDDTSGGAPLSAEERWVLPDGRRALIPRQPLGAVAGEGMFDVRALGLEGGGGVQHLALAAVRMCDEGMIGALLGGVLLAGGNTMIPGFGGRLQMEMERMTRKSTRVDVVAPRDRMYSAWVGGSILSQLSTFESMCVSRAEYEETSPEVVYRKCL